MYIFNPECKKQFWDEVFDTILALNFRNFLSKNNTSTDNILYKWNMRKCHFRLHELWNMVKTYLCAIANIRLFHSENLYQGDHITSYSSLITHRVAKLAKYCKLKFVFFLLWYILFKVIINYTIKIMKISRYLNKKKEK